MAEYIEREAFKKEYLCLGYLPEMSETEFDKFPSADVAPVRHGRWVLDEYARYFRCSACGAQFDNETDTYCNIMNGFAPNYCEDCGAKMDGGAD